MRKDKICRHHNFNRLGNWIFDPTSAFKDGSDVNVQCIPHLGRSDWISYDWSHSHACAHAAEVKWWRISSWLWSDRIIDTNWRSFAERWLFPCWWCSEGRDQYLETCYFLGFYPWAAFHPLAASPPLFSVSWKIVHYLLASAGAAEPPPPPLDSTSFHPQSVGAE